MHKLRCGWPVQARACAPLRLGACAEEEREPGRDRARGRRAGGSRGCLPTLVRKGVLDRIRPGLYAVRPFRAMARPWTLPSLVAVELLLAGERHYIGGLAAFTLHRLTQQQYAFVVDAFTTSFRRPRRLGEAEIRFHRRKPSLFESGLTTNEIDGTQVVVSDPERTVLDALEEPHIVGGMQEARRLFDEAVCRSMRRHGVSATNKRRFSR